MSGKGQRGVRGGQGGQGPREGRGRGGGGYQQGGGGGRGYQQRGDSYQQSGGGGFHQRSGGQGGEYQQSGSGGGGYQQRGGEGRDYQQRGGRGGGQRGGRGRGKPQRSDPPPRVEYKNFNVCPDPYQQPVDPKWIKEIKEKGGWKALPEKQEEVKLHQKNLNDIPQWGKQRIQVYTNHFLIQSNAGTGKFPFPNFYHYDISYDIERKHRKGQDDSKPKTKKSSGKRKEETEVERVTKGMGRSSISGRVGGDGGDPSPQPGQAPAGKKLPKHLTKTILDYLIPGIRNKYNHQAIATDGSFNLYITRKLEELNIPPEHEVTFEQLRQANLSEEEDNALIKVTFQPSIDKATGRIHTINTESIAKYFQERGSLLGLDLSPELRQTLEAACNAFVRAMPNFNYFSVGRSTMVPCANAEFAHLGGGLMAWKGVSASISMGWKPYLNVDIANCAFILDKQVTEILKQIIKWGDPTDIQKWTNKEYDDVKGLLKTCKVSYMIDHQKRSGPVKDIPRKLTPRNHTFDWTEKNKRVNVETYFKERYNIKLQHPDGPLLAIRKNGNYIPAELCTVRKGQSYNRKLDGDQTTKMIDFARKDPDESKEAVESRMKNMNLAKNEVLQGLGVKINDEMLKVTARVLVPPAIRYGNKSDNQQQIAHLSPTDGTWEIWRQGDFDFYRPTKVDKWAVLVVGCPRVEQPTVDVFVNCLISNGKKKGIVFSTRANPVTMLRTRREWTDLDTSKELEKYLQKFKDEKYDIVVCVFPRKGDPLYRIIKHAAEVQVGILTQCVAERNLVNKFGQENHSCIQNILLKMNSKLNGVNHVTVPPFDKTLAKQFCTLLMDCPIMVLGADVTHPPPGSRKTLENGEEWDMPSYAAVTGSLDRTCMPFMTEVRAQRKANAGAAEVIQNLTEIAIKMLRSFQAQAKGFPLKIIYFRDGVGEGQFPEVLHKEMNAIREACKNIGASYQPKITFITVQKRHKTRMFWDLGENGIENAPAGTVIDQEIVHPTEHDFYLLSHKGLLGTSRPSRYHVLWDDSDLSQDELQSLTYTLCYMYARCTKSVKMPAPTYYAHLAADRAKKLCEGFETRNGPPTVENLNEMLKRKMDNFPMHFV